MKAIIGILAAGMMGTSAWAQKATIAEGESAGMPTQIEKGQGQSGADATPEKMNEKSIIGKTVYDEKGRELGRIQDLVMDMERGELGYAVMEVKGEDGLKLPVPARALQQGEDGLVLNVSPSVLGVLEIYRDEELPEPDAFSVEGQEAVGGPAGAESGSEESEQNQKSDEDKKAEKPQVEERKRIELEN
jgi:hypothetical protein